MIAALVPAAGSSSRMGQPKLLLKFDGMSMIGRLVAALRKGGARRVVVIAPPDDAAEGPAVATEARLAGAEVLVPLTRPAEDARFDLAWPGSPGTTRPPPKRGIDARRLSRDYGRVCRPAHRICGQQTREHHHSMSQRPAGPSDRLTLDDCGPDRCAAGRRGRQCARGQAWDIGHRIRNAQP